MFYLIAAELAAKLRFDFQGRGKSREYVHKFFEEICSDEHRCVLAQAFQNSGGHSLNVRKAADYLYDIRCDVVHMGSYYLSTLAHNGHRFIVQAADEPHKMMTTTFGIEQLRAIVLEGAVNAANALISHLIRGAPSKKAAGYYRQLRATKIRVFPSFEVQGMR